MGTSLWRLFGAGFALAAFSALIGAGTASAATAAVPTLDWAACPAAAEGRASTAGLLCASASVPLDHAAPAAGSITLAVIKAQARKAETRIGTLFWNPGGPGDAGTEYLPAALKGFPDAVRDRFDIISWDPRGMGGGSLPVIQCFKTAAEEAAFLDRHLSDAAVTQAELAADTAARRLLNAACNAEGGPLLAHVSTADNARDLDLLRQAVGEEKLSYYGTSYGTFLGATYLNLFPDHVRAAVLDGAVAPDAWMAEGGEGATLSTFLRLGSDFGSARTIRAFMDACGAVSQTACPFAAGSPEKTRAKWQALLDRAKRGIALDGETIDDRAIADYVASSLYLVEPLPGFGRFPGWQAVAATLQAMWQAGEAAPQPASAVPVPPGPPTADKAGSAPSTRETYLTSVGRQLAVICGESPNPQTDAAIAAQAEASYRRAGVSPWPFVASCAGWTTKAAAPYRRPWDKARGVPVLVIGNSFDPATAFPSSVRMAQVLGDAALLTVNGYGHTVLLNPSRCAGDFIADALINGHMPPLGATCDQDIQPFPGD